jgi:hypothetical protein
MRELEQWLQANDKYLGEALSELRARLERLANQETGRGAATPPPAVREAANKAKAQPTKQRSLWEKLLSSQPTEAKNPPIPSAGPEDTGAPAAATAAESEPSPAAMPEAGTTEPTPALVLLAQRLGLTKFERDTLLLCAAMELDTCTASLCARVQGDPARPYPTFALALALFDNPAWDVLSPERPLRYWRLIEINQPGAQPLVTSAIKADERIVNYLKGLNYLDDRLAPLMAPVAANDDALPPSQQRIDDLIVQKLRRPRDGACLPVFQLLGADGQSKLSIARHACESLGLTLYRVAADAVPAQSGDHETFVRLWQRESALLPVALYIDAAQVEHTGSPYAGPIQRLVSRSGGMMFLDTREPWPDLGRDALALDVMKPTPAEQQEAWAEALGESGQGHAPRLAGHFNFNVATIKQIASAASSVGKDNSQALAATLWTDCLRRARPALDQLAQAIEPKASWDNLELPASEKNLLRHIADQVEHRAAVYDGWGFRERMNRGLGISVLFAGESGTGKTMAAEVIANELELLLYRIDLSAVVNKYIGETEKNLRKLFDAAEDGGAILFFDEADALFGKRSEVKDSHDRYANIEINYLLQRMEVYRGLAILATNIKSALDTTFVRRLRFIVNFPFPGPVERMAIWQKVFPRQTPTKGLDFQRLARLNLTGGSIHNIALNAAFLAARSGTEVTMPLILEAARIEFRKLEKPINEADFRWLETAGASA